MTDSSKEKKNDGAYKSRRKARELALHTLYACEVGGTTDWEMMLNRICETNAMAPDVRNYSRELVRKAMDTMEDIDQTLSERAANWELRRMAAIDRNILRLAVAELKYFTEVPFKVVIDEAVELAKLYGTDESGKFVNGIIDSVHKLLVKED